jgi:hypothetical protein
MDNVLFITYSSHDEFQVQQIASELRKQIPVFAYPFDIPGGAQINEGIKGRPEHIILAIALSQSSIAEQWIESKISKVILEPYKDSMAVLFLKLEGIPANILSTLPYGNKYETIDLSGEYYRTGILTLMQRIGSPLPTVIPRTRRHVPYEIGGIFQPARPATELFADLKRQIEHGNIDQKYLYWDVRAALRWQRIAELSSYMTSQMSTNLLVVNAQNIINVICADTNASSVSFINLGVGTGVKDYHILLRLLERNKKVVYIAVDESFPMIQLTMKTLEELLSSNVDSLSAHYIVDDFANLGRHSDYITSIEPENAPRIIGFLGASIGNFNESKIISTIGDLMSPKDYLILGVEYIADRDDKTLIRNYSDIRMKEFLFGPIMDITGREPDWDRDFQYSIISRTTFPAYSTVEQSKAIVGKVRYNGKEIELFFSIKYEKQSLERFLQKEGHFTILDTFTTPETPPRYGKYILKLA